MGLTDFKDLTRAPEKVTRTAAMLATNAAHLARPLKDRPIPARSDRR